MSSVLHAVLGKRIALPAGLLGVSHRLQQLQDTHVAVKLWPILMLRAQRGKVQIMPGSFCNALLHLILQCLPYAQQLLTSRIRKAARANTVCLTSAKLYQNMVVVLTATKLVLPQVVLVTSTKHAAYWCVEWVNRTARELECYDNIEPDREAF